VELKNAGDSCILDFSEIAGYVFGSMVRYDDTLNRNDRRRITKIIEDMINDYIDRNLIWARYNISRDLESDVKRFWPIIKPHPNPKPVMAELNDMIADLFADVLEIPTWRLVYLQFYGTSVEVELGEDFRIKDWMEKFGADFNSKPPSII
jgi:hypothetical protein